MWDQKVKKIKMIWYSKNDNYKVNKMLKLNSIFYSAAEELASKRCLFSKGEIQPRTCIGILLLLLR